MPGDFFCRSKSSLDSVTAAEKVSIEIIDGRNSVSDGTNCVSDVKNTQRRLDKRRLEKRRLEQSRQDKRRQEEMSVVRG